MRCPDCAGTRPTVRANPAGVLAAAGAGLAVATVVSIGWGFFPVWQFYFALLLGFGVVETMARLLKGRQGADLQAIAIVIVLYGLLLSRVVMAQRLDIDFAVLSAFAEFSAPLQRALYLRPIPDVLFALLPIAIAWIRFR